MEESEAKLLELLGVDGVQAAGDREMGMARKMVGQPRLIVMVDKMKGSPPELDGVEDLDGLKEALSMLDDDEKEELLQFLEQECGS